MSGRNSAIPDKGSGRSGEPGEGLRITNRGGWRGRAGGGEGGYELQTHAQTHTHTYTHTPQTQQ